MSQSAYGKLERGETKITWEKLNRIAEILKITAFEIANFDAKHSYKPTVVKDQLIEHSSDADSVLRERVKFLERINDTLRKQLDDKNEIIRLLRAKASTY